MGGRAQTKTKDSRISQKPKPPWLRYRVKKGEYYIAFVGHYSRCSSSKSVCSTLPLEFCWGFFMCG